MKEKSQKFVPYYETSCLEWYSSVKYCYSSIIIYHIYFSMNFKQYIFFINSYLSSILCDDFIVRI